MISVFDGKSRSSQEGGKEEEEGKTQGRKREGRKAHSFKVP